MSLAYREGKCDLRTPQSSVMNQIQLRRWHICASAVLSECQILLIPAPAHASAAGVIAYAIVILVGEAGARARPLWRPGLAQPRGHVRPHCRQHGVSLR